MSPCAQCNGSGLKPFKNKNSVIVENCYIYCSCRHDEPEHCIDLQPSDFDFPISYDYHQLLCQEHGWRRPVGPILAEATESTADPRPAPIISVTYKVDRVSLSPAFKTICERIAKLEGRLSKYFEERKKPKPKDYGHEGIV